jgi:serine/threonine protein kinase
LLPAINKLINDLCEKNIKHGDPNLQNILYDSSNKKIYLIDYGMSKIIDKKDKDYNLLKQKNLISYYNLFTKLETVLMKKFDLKNHPILTGNPLIDVKTGEPAISILHFAQADGVIDSIAGTYNEQRKIKERIREKMKK